MCAQCRTVSVSAHAMPPHPQSASAGGWARGWALHPTPPHTLTLTPPHSSAAPTTPAGGGGGRRDEGEEGGSVRRGDERGREGMWREEGSVRRKGEGKRGNVE